MSTSSRNSKSDGSVPKQSTKLINRLKGLSRYFSNPMLTQKPKMTSAHQTEIDSGKVLQKASISTRPSVRKQEGLNSVAQAKAATIDAPEETRTDKSQDMVMSHTWDLTSLRTHFTRRTPRWHLQCFTPIEHASVISSIAPTSQCVTSDVADSTSNFLGEDEGIKSLSPCDQYDPSAFFVYEERLRATSTSDAYSIFGSCHEIDKPEVRQQSTVEQSRNSRKLFSASSWNIVTVLKRIKHQKRPPKARSFTLNQSPSNTDDWMLDRHAESHAVPAGENLELSTLSQFDFIHSPCKSIYYVICIDLLLISTNFTTQANLTK
ncbi:hypothetical protein CSKR_202504 [Clonorchis sinensis]|uniref:Uncharacterized protein n=1 Tax=Clonorchis sinensis TaxID=79923 RepID=A0A8T1MWL1_CLOSI|nr:hypothetical protein CSKR_202504 [Clonorchis sinensis]